MGKNGRWSTVDHPRCQRAGSPAEGAKCPAHNVLVWLLGTYSTYRGCNVAGCTAGHDGNGDPSHWRIAGKGSRTPDDATPRTPGPAMQDDAIPEYAPDPDDTHTPTPTPKDTRMAPIPTPPALTPGNPLANLGSLGDLIGQAIETRAREIATEEIAKIEHNGPSRVVWEINGAPLAEIDGAHHSALPRLLKLYSAGFRAFLIVGPAGSGKTTLATQMAASLGVAVSSVSCSGGMSESALTGRAIPNLTDGTVAYQSTEFVERYESGGVFLLDEIDAADPNVLISVNSALANGFIPLPNRTESPRAKRHPDSVVIAAANTWGSGADRQYVGRNQLDAATLDRFVGATIAVDYDRALESAIVGDAHICARVWEIRSACESLKIRRVVGTRFLMSVARLVKSGVDTLPAALLACSEGWTTDERSRAGIRGAA